MRPGATRPILPDQEVADRGSWAVYVAADDVVEERQVTTGLAAGEVVEILTGLTAIDIVVRRAASFVRPGDRVASVSDP